MAEKFIAKPNQLPKWLFVGMTFVILGCVAAMDFLTGYEISCTVFYLLAAGLATWFVGPSFGILVSVLSAISTSAMDIVSGERYSNRFVPIWDGPRGTGWKIHTPQLVGCAFCSGLLLRSAVARHRR